MKQFKNLKNLLMIIAVIVSSAHSLDEQMDSGQGLIKQSFFATRATVDGSWCGTTVEKTLSVGSSQLFGSPGYPDQNYQKSLDCRYSFKAADGVKLRLSCANLTLDWFTTLSFTDGNMTKTRGCAHCRGDFSFAHDFTAAATLVTFGSCFVDGPAFQCKMEAIPTAKKCRCGKDSANNIVGGTEVTPNKYGWIVSLQNKNPNFHLCGGSLISPNFVLTAAHCTVDRINTSFSAVLGAHDLSKPGPHQITRAIVKIIDHPRYKKWPAKDYDYSLLQIEKVDLAASPMFSPICLPQPSQSFVGKIVTVAGWGRTAINEDPSSVLLEVKQKVVSNEECQNLHPADKITDRMLCAGGDARIGVCRGDSGGALMLREPSGTWEVIGLVSWSYGCAVQDRPGVNANVTNMLGWIDDNTKGYESCVPA